MKRLWPILTVLHKEVVDNIRDRRSICAALLFPLLGPAATAGIIVLTGEVVSDMQDKPLSLPVVGQTRAPGLVRFLRGAGVAIKPFSGDTNEAVRKGDHDLVMVIPAGHGDQLRGGHAATVRLVVDSSRRSARGSARRIRRLVQAYGKQIGHLRLLARGVDPSLGQAMAIEAVDVSTPQSRAAVLLAVLPYFIVLSIFLGSFYVAIDTTAGELERRSLEPLLINPVGRWQLLCGKFLATLGFAIVGLAIAMVGFWLVPRLVSTESFGIPIQLHFWVLLQIFVLMLPLTAMAAAVQMILATFARSFKEAQTQLSFVMVVLVIPGTVLSIVPVKARAWMMLIPAFSEQLLIGKMIRGDEVAALLVVICMITTSIFACAGLLLATRLYRGERVFKKS